MTPASQKAGQNPIGFVLYDAAQNTVLKQIDLVIRPEELSRREPSRVLVHQTLGGAWADDFGEGITSIELSGTTGWHGNRKQDGAELFVELHDKIFKAWYAHRAAAAAAGNDPATIELQFSDALDGNADVVIPKSFMLKRSKTRPLLSVYNIQLEVLGHVSAVSTMYENGYKADPVHQATLTNNPYSRYSASVTALNANLTSQMSALAGAGGIFGDLAGVVNDFVGLSDSVLSEVLAVGKQVSGAFDSATAPLLAAALSLEQAGSNAFWALATVYGVEQNALYTLMKIAGNFHEAYCALINGFGLATQIPSLDGLFGASNCSSTGGGRPLSPYQFSNPFMAMFTSTPPNVAISDAAAHSLMSLGADVLTTDSYSVGTHLAAINSGMHVT